MDQGSRITQKCSRHKWVKSGRVLGAVGLMVGEPLSQALGQELEQFVVVLAGAAALPGGLAGDHPPDHLRLLPKNAQGENG